MTENNLIYTIFDVSELPLIDFQDVFETSEETVRRSLDGTKTFVKWEGETPQCVSSLTSKQGPYTHPEILGIMATSAWSQPFLEPR